MFCPNCAEKNDDDVKFCRGCGQDISLVAYSLKGHSPVVLVSKIDQIFDRPNESLLRDGILWLILGFVSLMINLWQLGRPDLLSVLGFSFGSWNLLLYKHSLSIKSKKSENKSPTTILYCPVCGESNKPEVDFCRRCGKELGFVKELISSQKFGWFARFLDKYFGWLARDINESTWARLSKKSSFKIDVIIPLLTGIGYLIYGLVNFFYFSKDPYLLIFHLFIAPSLLIVGLWNYVMGKRLGFEKKLESTPTYNLTYDFILDVIRFILERKGKIITVIILLNLIVGLVLAVKFGFNIVFTVLIFGSLLLLGILPFFSLSYLLVFLPWLINLYFPGFSYLKELTDNQQKEKRRIIKGMAVMLLILILLNFASNAFFSKDVIYSAQYFIILIPIVILRFWQYLLLQFGLVEVVKENANPETETDKSKTQKQESPKPLWGGSDLIQLGLFESDSRNEKMKFQTIKIEETTKRQLNSINAVDEINQVNEVETQRELDELKIAEPETKPLSQMKN